MGEEIAARPPPDQQPWIQAEGAEIPHTSWGFRLSPSTYGAPLPAEESGRR